MSAAGNCCRALQAASVSRVTDAWRMAMQVAGCLLAVAGLLGLVVLPPSAVAQARAGVPRIGILFFGAAPVGASPDTEKGYLQGLRELGYVEGQNIQVERRYGQGRPDRMALLAAELVQLKVEVIVAAGPGPREAARSATRTIPIVTVSGADPVSDGWAHSLARPGGNVTGLTVTFPELHLKRLELFKQAFPQIVRVAMLVHPVEAAGAVDAVRGMDADTRRLGLQLQLIEVMGPADFDAAFSKARQQHAQAVYAVATNTMVAHASTLAALAAAQRLLSISEFPLLAQAGFVMTYGADLDDLQRRSMMLVDKILKGAKVGEVPIERPTKFQLTVNAGAAKAMGITIPPSLLLRADEVIQ